MAHVGRIQLDSNVWAWSKLMTDKPDNLIQMVTGLAVDPQGSKVAAVAKESNRLKRFIFVLDARTGSLVSPMQILSVNTHAIQ